MDSITTLPQEFITEIEIAYRLLVNVHADILRGIH